MRGEEGLDRESKDGMEAVGAAKEGFVVACVREFEWSAAVVGRGKLAQLALFVLFCCARLPAAKLALAKKIARRTNTGLEVKESFGSMALRQCITLVPPSTKS